MRTLLLLSCLVGIGCSSTTVTKGPCKLWNGTYALDVTKRTGNCNVPSEVLVNANGSAPSVQAMSADNCTEQFDYACPSTDGNGQGVFRGQYDLAQDGSGGVPASVSSFFKASFWARSHCAPFSETASRLMTPTARYRGFRDVPSFRNIGTLRIAWTRFVFFNCQRKRP